VQSRIYVLKSTNHQKMEVRGSIHELLTRASDACGQVENSDDQMEANILALLRRVCEVSTGEIDGLIDEFNGLHEKLLTDLSHIQRDIAKYRELNQRVMQLATNVFNGMKELSDAPGI
jgi:methyl-accepting chemotaxis protein